MNTRYPYWHQLFINTQKLVFVIGMIITYILYVHLLPKMALDGILLAEVMIAVTSKRYSNPLSGRPLYIRLRTYYVNVIGMNYVFSPPKRFIV